MDNQFLIQILKDHLNNQPTVLPDDINLSSLIDCAKKQNLEGVVYYQTKIPELQKSYASAIYNYANRRDILDNLKAVLQKNSVEYFLVKGFSVSEFYPQPQLRTMGDCDIVVHAEDKNKVHELLLSLGAKCTHQGSHEWMYYLNQMEFEIHDHLIYEDVRNSEQAVEYFDAVWNNVEDNSLDWDFHFMFLLYHLRKHILGEGVGIRQFMDLAVIIKKIDLGWDKIKADIKYLELTEFCDHVFMLLKSWLDVEVPGYTVSVDDDFVESVTEKILNDGVFGFGNEENRFNKFAYDVNKRGRVRRIIDDTFYPYDKMITMEEYSFLKGKPFLLPAAWIYRIILKWKKRDQLKERYFNSNDRVNARMAYLKQWGL